MIRLHPGLWAYVALLSLYLVAPILVVCLVAFTPEGFLSLPTNGFSLR